MSHPTASTFRKTINAFEGADEVRTWLDGEIGKDRKLSAMRPRLEAVARYSRHFSPALVRFICKYTNAFVLLLENRHFPDKLLPLLIREAVREIEEWFSEERSKDSYDYATKAAQALHMLAQDGVFSGASPEAERLAEIVLRHMGGGLPPVSCGVAALLDAPDTPTRMLDEFAEWPRAGTLTKIARHPNSTYAHWQQLLKTDWSSDALRALGENPQARQHPHIRPVLIGYARFSDVMLAAPLLHDAMPDAREIARLLIESDPEYATRVLAEAPEAALARIEAEDLLPLLRSSDANVRLRAIGLQGKVATVSGNRKAAAGFAFAGLSSTMRRPNTQETPADAGGTNQRIAG
jgi:hypothetical protein